MSCDQTLSSDSSTSPSSLICLVDSVKFSPPVSSGDPERLTPSSKMCSSNISMQVSDLDCKSYSKCSQGHSAISLHQSITTVGGGTDECTREVVSKSSPTVKLICSNKLAPLLSPSVSQVISDATIANNLVESSSVSAAISDSFLTHPFDCQVCSRELIFNGNEHSFSDSKICGNDSVATETDTNNDISVSSKNGTNGGVSIAGITKANSEVLLAGKVITVNDVSVTSETDGKNDVAIPSGDDTNNSISVTGQADTNVSVLSKTDENNDISFPNKASTNNKVLPASKAIMSNISVANDFDVNSDITVGGRTVTKGGFSVSSVTVTNCEVSIASQATNNGVSVASETDTNNVLIATETNTNNNVSVDIETDTNEISSYSKSHAGNNLFVANKADENIANGGKINSDVQDEKTSLTSSIVNSATDKPNPSASSAQLDSQLNSQGNDNSFCSSWSAIAAKIVWNKGRSCETKTTSSTASKLSPDDENDSLATSNHSVDNLNTANTWVQESHDPCSQRVPAELKIKSDCEPGPGSEKIEAFGNRPKAAEGSPDANNSQAICNSLLSSFTSEELNALNVNADGPTFLRPNSKLPAPLMDSMGVNVSPLQNQQLSPTNAPPIPVDWKTPITNRTFSFHCGRTPYTTPKSFPSLSSVINNTPTGDNFIPFNKELFSPLTSKKSLVLTPDLLVKPFVIGQWGRQIILLLCERSKPGHVILAVDQHAAHERIRVEKLTRRHVDKSGQVLAVTLSTPHPINVSAEMRLYLEQQDTLKLLSKHGINLSLIDDGVEVKAVPQAIIAYCTQQDNYTQSYVESVIIELMERGSTAVLKAKALQDVLDSQACRGAIKFGDELSRDQCKAVINKLASCKLPFQCAHGRPSTVPLYDITSLTAQLPQVKAPQLSKLGLGRKS